MEIVIKIPDSLYANIINTWEKIHPQMWDAIKNGTPLPDHHGDLIDRTELLVQPLDIANYPSNFVRVAPTIIPADKE